MPTRVYQRIWCKKCNEFQLHRRKDDSLVCETCDTVYTDVYLKDIPKEHLIEQRKRYTESQTNRFNDVYMGLFKSSEQRQMEQLAHMFSEPGDDVEIIESDAGQKSIDDAKREKARKKREEWRIKREEEKKLQKEYQGLGRNDKCLCGSNLKYKNCCWQKVQSIR